MPTHAIKFASFADEIIVMKRGRIVRKGHFRDISETPEYKEVSLKTHEKEEEASKKEDENDE